MDPYRCMIRGVAAAAVLVHLSSASAQCGMTTALLVQPFCGGATVTVNTTSGGTAPFIISIDKRGTCSTSWWNVHWVTNPSNGNYFASVGGNLWEGAEYGRVTVTDALGCTATYTTPAFSAPYPPVFYPTAFISAEVDCVTGQHRLLMNSAHMFTLLNHYNYALDAGPSLPISGNWTATGSGYRSNFLVGSGTHTLSLTTPGSVPSGCGSFLSGCFQTETISVPTSPISTGDCGANISIRACLQGALPSGTLMHDSLRVKNLIPTTQPYTALGYTYTAHTGATTIAPALLTTTGANAIVDWVVVELRSSANSSQVLFSKPALIQRDGDVVDLDGDSYVNFPTAGGNYYVALRHRNHLGIMMNFTWNFTPTPTMVDFRVAALTCYGTNARATVGSVQCLWPGDANGNGVVSYTGLNSDRDQILQAIGGVVPTNALVNVYDRRDVNMDGIVRYAGAANDRDVILQVIGGVIPTNTRVHQLP